MIHAGFLSTVERAELIELARNGLAEHRLARRANALVLLDRGMSCENIGSVLLLDDDTIRTWRRLYREDGIAGLAGFGYEGSDCHRSAARQEKLKAWVGEALPRTTRHVGAWIEREFAIVYRSRSGLIALLHRLGMEHRKPQAVSRKLDAAKQTAFIEAYHSLLNTLPGDEAVMFADAVHPTHAARPVGCWAPKDTRVAVDQTSGRQRLNIHGAIDLETGQTRMREVLSVDAMSTIALLMAIEALYLSDAVDPRVRGQRPLPSRQVGPGVAGPAGAADQAPFHPAPGSGPGQALLSAPPIGPGAGSEPHRTPVGAHAQKRHPQPVLRHFRWFLRRHARLFEGKCSQKLGHLMRQRFSQFPRHIAQGFSGSDVSGVYINLETMML